MEVYFWYDLWYDECPFHKMPHLVTFEKKNRCNTPRDNETVNEESLKDLFHLPLSQQAYNESVELEAICQGARDHMQEGSKDIWGYIWKSENFTPKRAYNVLVGQRNVIPHFNWLWKTSCQAKHKLFFWLLLLD